MIMHITYIWLGSWKRSTRTQSISLIKFNSNGIELSSSSNCSIKAQPRIRVLIKLMRLETCYQEVIETILHSTPNLSNHARHYCSLCFNSHEANVPLTNLKLQPTTLVKDTNPHNMKGESSQTTLQKSKSISLFMFKITSATIEKERAICHSYIVVVVTFIMSSVYLS